jgi:hypothetical protein
MAFLDVDEIEPGMVLKSDVRTSKGHTLLVAGTEITARHIRILKSRDIDSIDIVGADDLYDIQNGAISQILPIEATAPISELFANTNASHPFIKELMRLCTQRAIEIHPRHDSHGS